MSPSWSVEGLEADVDRFHLGPIDLRLDAGHAVAVLGPSGAGKTTLLRALGGFVPVRRGRILRDGIDLTDWPPEGRALGYVPQGFGLFPHRTVAGNIRFPMEVRGQTDADRRTQELMEQFRLTPLATRHPSRLSGGEQQRVAIARALAAQPSLVVWDEPWQGLDVLARHELGLALRGLREAARIPVIVVTHDPALAFSIADSFLVLEAGRVRRQCDAPTLMGAPGDAFAARFVGFPNVIGREELDGGPADSLRDWLRVLAGSDGVAFAAPSIASGVPQAGRWAGTVRTVRPTPEGLEAELDSDRLLITVRLPLVSLRPGPAVGARIQFDIPAEGIQSLGDRSPRGRGG